MANLIFLIVVAAVAVGLLILQTNSGLVLLALCAGSVLVQFANRNMAYVNGHLDKGLLPHRFVISSDGVLIAIMLAPAVIVAVLQRHNFGISKWPIQVFPAVAAGLLGSLLTVPLLPQSVQNNITQSRYWSLAEQNQVALVFLCVLVGLVAVIFSGHNHHSKGKSKQH